MLQITKITPLDRRLRTFVNPFIETVSKAKTKTKTDEKPNKQTIKQPHQIELDRYKGQEVEGYEPLYRKLNEQYPVTPRY